MVIHIISNFLTKIKRKLGFLKRKRVELTTQIQITVPIWKKNPNNFKGKENVMESKIKSLVEQIFEDVSVLKESQKPQDRIGAEIMALNAVVNAAKFLEKEKTTE